MLIYKRKEEDMSRKRKKSLRSESTGNNQLMAAWLLVDDGNIILPEGYTPLSKNEDILQCADKIADPVSSMTIMLMENGEDGDRRIKNELSRKIDITPNRFLTRKNFIYSIVRDMVIFGNSVCVPRYTADGYLDTIDMLDASRASFLPTSDGTDYVINYNGIYFRPDEVLHFPLNPKSETPYKGSGYTDSIKHTVANLLQLNTTKKSYLQSKWQPSLIISVETDAEELTDPDMRRKILGSYRAESERGEPWLIPAGEIKVESIKPLTLNDLAINDGIQLDKKALAAAIGVPAFLVGIGDFDDKAYNHFVSTRIMSFAQIIQQEFTRKLIYSQNWYFKLNPNSLMQYSLTEKMSYVKEMVGNGMMTRNEGRQEFDRAPSDKEGMNDFVVLENYIPVAKIDKQKKLIQDKEV